MKLTQKFWLLFLTTVFCLVASSLIGWERAALAFNPAALTQFFTNAGPSSVGLFIGAHVIANAIGVPGTLLVVVGGAVFGLWWGMVWYGSFD